MRALLVAVFGVGAVVNGCNCGEQLGGVPGNLTGRVCHPDTGAGLAGAAVTVDGPVHRSTLSDGQGHYTFDLIPAGTYNLTATAGAVTRKFQAKVDPQRSAADGDTIVDDTACRDQPIDPNAGELDGQICNRHTGSFVTDANVTITSADKTYATTTDSTGSFKLPGVPQGEQIAEVRGNGYQRSFRVEIPAGGVAQLDLAGQCNPVSATEGGMVGSFCDPANGGNLVGATVTAQLLDGNNAPVAGEVFTDVTDTDGNFEINGLEPGPYEVSVTGDSNFTSVVNVVAASEVTVTDPANCANRPAFGRVEGQICDYAAGGRFAGNVDLLDGSLSLVQSTVSDNEGRFAFDQVTPGTYTVRAHKDDATPPYVKTYSGVVVQAFQTAFVQETNCPVPQDVCADTVNQPQVSADGRIMLVVDRSGSMGELGSDGQVKWNSIKAALENVTSSLQSTVEFGLMMFPQPGADVCTAGSQVEVDLAKNSASSIQQQLESPLNAPNGGTPTAATLAFAKQVLQPIASDGRPLAVLIATDGGPNCNDALDGSFATCRCTQPDEQGNCGVDNCLDDLNTINAVGQIKDLGVNVFVIGEVGSENFADVLNNMASVGGTALPGTTKFYEVGGQADLTAALQEITNRVLSCHVDVTGVDLTTADSITVSVGQQTFARDPAHQNGWDVTSPSGIDLYGAACDIASSSSDNVTVHTCHAP